MSGLSVSRSVRGSLAGRILRVIVAGVLAITSTAACAGSTSTSPGAGAAAKQCVVGAAWFEYWDGAVGGFVNDALQGAIEPAYGSSSYLAREARGSTEDQVRNIDYLVRNGANVLVMSPSREGTELPAVERAIKAGIPVIVLNDPIAAPSLFIGFDQVEAGRQAAKGMLAVKPKGRYAIVGSSEVTSSTNPIAVGIREGLQPAVDRGDITIVATVPLPWPATYEQWVSTILEQSGGKVDAIVSDTDGLASQLEPAFVAARRADEFGTAGVSGVSDPGDASEGLFGIVDGRQTVDVWENGELVAAATVKAVLAACEGADVTKVAGSASVKWPGREPMTAILLAPMAITKDNLGVVAGTDEYWWKRLCDGDPRLAEPVLVSACAGRPAPAVTPSAQSQP